MLSFEAATAGFIAGAGVGAALVGVLAWRRERRLGRFLSFAAHEFNTPLTAVNMTVVNFISGALGSVDKSQQPWLEMLREQVERASAIMGDMRDFIHLKLRDGLFLRLEEVDALPILEAAVSSVSWGFSHAGFSVKIASDTGIPKVKADPERLLRIITDVLYHCRKFRSSGGLDVSVKSPSAGRVQVRFTYAGTKMSSDEISQALDIFYPARVRKDDLLTAAGLGLGAAKLFLNKQEGDLIAWIEPDGRVTIVIELKAAAGA